MSKLFAAHFDISRLAHEQLLPLNARFALAAVALSALVGVRVLLGWLLDLERIKSVIPGLVSMKANTAPGFVLAGLSLWLLGTEPRAPANHRVAHGTRIAVVLALIVALLGLATLGEYVFGWNLGIDQLLFSEPDGTVETNSPGRMAPTTALTFLITGLGLLLSNRKRGILLGQGGSLITLLVSTLAVLSYAYDVPTLRMAGQFTGMAAHTSVTFCLLSVGILLVRPDRGLMPAILAENAGGVLPRRLIPAAIAVPFLLGYLHIRGEREGWFATGFGLALMVISSMVIFIALIWWTSGVVHRMEVERGAAAGSLRESEEFSRRVIASSNDCINVLDKLPKIDGLEVLPQINADPRTQAIPVVIMTSSQEERDIVRSYSMGVNSYVVKPVDFDQFVESMRVLGMCWLLLNKPPVLAPATKIEG